MKLIRLLLFPFSLLYLIITTIRNYLFDSGLLSATSFNKPVITVGNLSVGGTGKTPQIEYLIELLRITNNVGVLSRGYGRKTKGFILANNSSTASEIGDEPLQFYKKFENITVAVDEDRVHGIRELNKLKNSPNVILLDDAFQHRKVKAGYNILLTKYNELFSNDFLLPSGNLRERRVGAKRADVVIITKCPKSISIEEKEGIKQLIQRYFSGPIFFSEIEYSEDVKNAQGDVIKTTNLFDYGILLVTGIANPTHLLAYLTEQKCSFTHLNFPDHHKFSTSEIEKIQQQFEKLSSTKKIILTTEKDFVRLSNQLENLFYLPITTIFIENQQEFDSLIINYVKAAL